MTSTSSWFDDASWALAPGTSRPNPGMNERSRRWRVFLNILATMIEWGGFVAWRLATYGTPVRSRSCDGEDTSLFIHNRG
jgi:hypothetical protein